MLPSVVGREVQEGLESYLTFGFEPSNPFFSGIVRAFAAQPGNLVKGPYISLGLPFRAGKAGRDLFALVRPHLVPHVHQEAAWARLRCDTGPRSTLIATGRRLQFCVPRRSRNRQRWRPPTNLGYPQHGCRLPMTRSLALAGQPNALHCA
jgi:hypothetical protein